MKYYIIGSFGEILFKESLTSLWFDQSYYLFYLFDLRYEIFNDIFNYYSKSIQDLIYSTQ